MPKFLEVSSKSAARDALIALPGVAGDGTTNDRSGLAAADTAALAAGSPLFLVGGKTYRVGSNLTIASPVVAQPGAVIKPDAGVTVTLSGGFSGAPKQVFDHSAGGKVAVAGIPAAPVEWWGPLSNAALDSAAVSGTPVRLGPVTYSTATGLVVPSSRASILGSSMFVTKVDWTGGAGDTDMIDLSFAGNPLALSGWRAEEFWLTNPGRDGIVISDDKREFIVRRVRVSGARRHGIRLGESWNATLERVYVYQSALDGIHTLDRTSPIADAPGQALNYIGCHVLNNGRDGLRVGDRCLITGCIIEDNVRAGVMVEGRFGVLISSNYWEGANNYYDPANPKLHLWIKDSQSISVRDEPILNSVPTGIMIQNSYHVRLDGLQQLSGDGPQWDNETGTADATFALYGQMNLWVDSTSYDVTVGPSAPIIYFTESDPAEGKVRFDQWFDRPPTANLITTGRLSTDSDADGLADGWSTTTTPPTAVSMDTAEAIHGLPAVQKFTSSANNQGIYTSFTYADNTWYTVGAWVRGTGKFKFFRGTSGSAAFGPEFSSYATHPRWRFVTAAFQTGTSWTGLGIKSTTAGSIWVTGVKIVKGRLSHNQMPPYGVNETYGSPLVETLDVGASDTTIARSAAGAITVEGVPVALNSTTLTHTAQQIELGHASDTTITRLSAGRLGVEGIPLVRRTIQTITGAATISATSGDQVVLIDTGGLPTLATAVGATAVIELKNLTAAGIAIGTTSSQTIGGESSYVLPANHAIELVSDQSNWRIK